MIIEGPIDWRWITDLDRYEVVRHKPRVWEPLYASVKENGIVNPIVVWATHGDIRVRYGGTRSAVARELDLLLMAVICDYDNRFPGYERLTTVDDIAAKWVDPDAIRPSIDLGPTKLSINHHRHVPINVNGDCF